MLNIKSLLCRRHWLQGVVCIILMGMLLFWGCKPNTPEPKRSTTPVEKNDDPRDSVPSAPKEKGKEDAPTEVIPPHTSDPEADTPPAGEEKPKEEGKEDVSTEVAPPHTSDPETGTPPADGKKPDDTTPPAGAEKPKDEGKDDAPTEVTPPNTPDSPKAEPQPSSPITGGGNTGNTGTVTPPASTGEPVPLQPAATPFPVSNNPEEESSEALNAKLLKVFTDLSCSRLKDDARLQDVEALPATFNYLARTLQSGTYPLEEQRYRIQEYNAYTPAIKMSQKFHTRKYSKLNSPTGMYIPKGGKRVIRVLASGIGDKKITLGTVEHQNQEADYQYFLKDGLNEFPFYGGGLLYVFYNSMTPRQERPIKLHFPPNPNAEEWAQVGYNLWDKSVDKTQTKMKALIDKCQAPIFILRGDITFYSFATSDLKDLMRTRASFDAKRIMDRWDSILSWTEEIVGLDEARQKGEFNNQMQFSTIDGIGIWAGDGHVNTSIIRRESRTPNHIQSIWDWVLPEDMDKGQRRQLTAGHELGHMQQGGINWAGVTESSNGVAENYVIYKLGKYGSQGETLMSLSKNRYAKDPVPFLRFGYPRNEKGEYEPYHYTNRTMSNEYGLYQGEDAELHTRMFWQLWMYTELCGEKPGAYREIYRLGRMAADANPTVQPGELQLRFAQNVARVLQMDMTEFFDAWGFFLPLQEFTLFAYSPYTAKVTPEMIAQTKAFMKQFPRKCPPIQYMEDRYYSPNAFNGMNRTHSVEGCDVGHYTTYCANKQITDPRQITYTVNELGIAHIDGNQKHLAVAYELRKRTAGTGIGEVLWFSNMYTFKIPEHVRMQQYDMYAVQADGKRIKVELQSSPMLRSAHKYELPSRPRSEGFRCSACRHEHP